MKCGKTLLASHTDWSILFISYILKQIVTYPFQVKCKNFDKIKRFLSTITNILNTVLMYHLGILKLKNNKL